MQDNFKFKIQTPYTITGENVGGLLFDIIALKTDSTVAPIADLEKVSIDITYKAYKGDKGLAVFSGYLQTLLNAFYTQDTRLPICLTAREEGYKIFLDFGKLPFDTRQGQELKVELNFSQDAFTNLSLTNSSINFYTIPTEYINTSGKYIQVQYETIPTDKVDFSESLGSDIVSIVCATDNSANYGDSTKAKLSTISLNADGFNKDTDETLLEVENLKMLSYNPDTPLKNLVVYRGSMLHNVSLKAKFSSGVATGTKIITTKLVSY